MSQQIEPVVPVQDEEGSEKLGSNYFLAPRIAESSKRRSKITLRANSAKSQLCGHCNLSLSLKTFKKHKRLYCNSDGKWLLSTDKDLYQDTTGIDIDRQEAKLAVLIIDVLRHARSAIIIL